MGKAKREFSEARDTKDSSNIELLESALIDLRKAIKLAPQNLELHRYISYAMQKYQYHLWGVLFYAIFFIVRKTMVLSFRYTIRVKEELDAQKEEIIQSDNPSIPCEGIDDSKNTNDNSI